MENVKGLLSHDKGRTFGTIIQALDELGYVVEWQLFNSKFWGVPQNRERVYILVTRQDVFNGSKLFDLGKQQKKVTSRLVDVLEEHVEETYYLSNDKTKNLTLNTDFSGRLNHYDYRAVDSIHSPKKVVPTLNTMQGGDRQPKIAIPVLTSDRVNKRQNGRRFKDDGEEMFTLTAQDKHGVLVREATKQGYTIAKQGDSVNVAYPKSKTRRGRVGKQVAQTLQAGDVNQGVVTKDIRIRKLTPLECWRLQGFTDEQFQKAKDSGMSNSQLYKQAGNAVTVNVVDAIVSKLK